MADIVDWTGAPGARFDDPASWLDATLDAPAGRAPGAEDTAVFARATGSPPAAAGSAPC